MGTYCGLPGPLPVLLELRESSSEAGSSAQTPQSPDGPDEFFESLEEPWREGPGTLPHPGTLMESGPLTVQSPKSAGGP